MLEYITPARLRVAGLGTALPTSDLELRSLIRIASGLVNNECTTPRDHDFRGGSVTNEQHPWDIGNNHVPGQRRVYPDHYPVTEVDRFEIRVTTSTHGSISFPTDEIYLDKTEGYIEIVSLSLTTASVYAAGLLPNIGLAKPVLELDYDYGWEYSHTDEELQPAAASGNTEFYGESLFWTDDAVTIKVNSVVNTANTIDRESGIVTFNAPVANGATVTATYVSKLHPDITLATALIASDVVAQARINRTGLQGLSGLRVLEVEIRQSRTGGFLTMPVSAAASGLLQKFRYRTFG